MIYIPEIEQLCEDRETWEQICDLAENKQVNSPLLLDFQSDRLWLEDGMLFMQYHC